MNPEQSKSSCRERNWERHDSRGNCLNLEEEIDLEFIFDKRMSNLVEKPSPAGCKEGRMVDAHSDRTINTMNLSRVTFRNIKVRASIIFYIAIVRMVYHNLKGISNHLSC